MGMMTLRLWRWLVPAALILGIGCADSIVREISSDNDPQVINTPQKFQFTATDLRNVNDELVFTWPNSAPKATFHHDSFLDHGYGIVTINDAAGVLVDSTLLELDLETDTRAGTPGNWTITLTFASARGRTNFILTPKP
jgi:hypothetical protein